MKNKWRIIFLWVCLITSIPLSAEITEHQVNEITYVYDSDKNMIYNKNNVFPDGGKGDRCVAVGARGIEILHQKLRNIFSKERIKESGLTSILARIYVTSTGSDGEIVFRVGPEMKEKLTYQDFYAMEKALKQFKDYMTFYPHCSKGDYYILGAVIPFDSLYGKKVSPYWKSK